MLFIVPSDPLHPARPDDHFALESAVARDLGAEVAVVDLDALTNGDPEEAVRRVRTGGEAVYRGWMVSSPDYGALSGALTARGVSLRTTPDAYRAAHELPGWYRAFEMQTPRSVWTDGPDIDAAIQALDALPHGSAVVKDYVKSMKHYWAEATFIPDTLDRASAKRVLERFLELRGPDLEGGVVVRQYERFTGPELRTWWLSGRCVLVSPHPDQPETAVPEPFSTGHLQDSVARLGAPFITVDVAHSQEAGWRVVEVGDGQVSDRPATTPPEALLQPLLVQ